MLASLWILSEFRRDYMWVRIPRGGAQRGHLKFDADSCAGQLELSWQVWSEDQFNSVRAQNALANHHFFHNSFGIISRDYSESYPATRWNRLGFRYYTAPTHSSIYFPYWFACVLTGPLPAYWLHQNRRSVRWAKAGLCPSCGYDIRVTPDRCPECGKNVAMAG